MLVKLAGGRVYDPINGVDGEVRDLWIEDGRDRAGPPPTAVLQTTLSTSRAASSCRAGSTCAATSAAASSTSPRMMLPEEHRAYPHPRHDGLPLRQRSCYSPSTSAPATPTPDGLHHGVRAGDAGRGTPGRRTTRWRDIPLLDKGAYVLLGSEDLLLRMLSDGSGKDAGPRPRRLDAGTLTSPCAVKIVNPGGINAFKWGARHSTSTRRGRTTASLRA